MTDLDVNDKMSNLLLLPVEIIELILSFNILDHSDIIRISRVCKKLNDISQNNEVWRTKLRQKWPHMQGRHSGAQPEGCWYTRFKRRYLIGQKVVDFVSQLSPKFYNREEMPKEECQLLGYEEENEYIIDELMALIHDGREHENLTMKYYAEKVLRFVQQDHLKPAISKFVQDSVQNDDQHIELGACLIAQWCQPTENVNISDILQQMDSLAMDVKSILRESDSNHPVVQAELHEKRLADNLWTCIQCRAILETLNTVLFKKHQYSGNTINYYNQKNSYIDKVLKLKTGIPITLCIVYLAVARRLGVFCEPVNFPSHFLIRWKEHPMKTQDCMYTYIDVFNGGTFFSQSELAAKFNIDNRILRLDDAPPSSIQVLTRMIRNLVSIGRQQERMGDNLLCLRNALELYLLFSPEDFQFRLLLVRVNVHLNINLAESIDMLQRLGDANQNILGLEAYLASAVQAKLEENRRKCADQEEVIKPKTRQKSEDAKFSVGLIMKHKRYDYKCVIYGWDTKCMASREWIVQMGVHTLPHADKQPFYNVLVEDGSNRYAAEENLEVDEHPQPVTHPEVGKYFDSYQGAYYSANKEKATEYPQDVEMTLIEVRKLHS